MLTDTTTTTGSKLENIFPLGFLSSHLISSHLNPLTLTGPTDDAAKIPFHHILSSAALRESPNPIPVHSSKNS